MLWHLPFREYDVEKSPAYYEMYQDLDGDGVPYIIIGKRRIPGFKQQEIIDAAVGVGILQRKGG
jgi:hypothetical protein